MELSEVIQPHYSEFCEKVVDPVSLASRLRSLTSNDIDFIQCSRARGRLYGVKVLRDAIVGKVTWPELYAALRAEKLTDLAKILHEEYYQQHPTAQPCPEDEHLSPGVDLIEQGPADSCSDSKMNDRANSNPCIIIPAAGFSTSNIIHANTFRNVIDPQNVHMYIQIGDNNCINTGPYVEKDGTTSHTEPEVQYEVESMARNESEENTSNSPVAAQHGDLPNEPTATPQTVSPQFSSSSSQSQDGGCSKVHCPNETADNTAEKLVFEERYGGGVVHSRTSDNISLHGDRDTMSESSGHNEIRDEKHLCEELCIKLRTKAKRCGEDDEEEEETELKKLINEKSCPSVM